MEDTNGDKNNHKFLLYYTSGTLCTSISFVRFMELSSILWTNQDANEEFGDEYWVRDMNLLAIPGSDYSFYVTVKLRYYRAEWLCRCEDREVLELE